MKKKQTLVCGFLAVMFVLSFGACSGGGQKLTGPTDSFIFNVIGGGAAYSVVGIALEGKVSIPAYYRPNAQSDYLPVTKIDRRAFSGCKNLTSITIPNSVTSIGDEAFENCTGLTSITLPNSVTSIGGEVFLNCTSLASITIPASVNSVGFWPFGNWTSSQTINVQGKNQAAADAAWGEDWRGHCNAKIFYQGK